MPSRIAYYPGMYLLILNSKKQPAIWVVTQRKIYRKYLVQMLAPRPLGKATACSNHLPILGAAGMIYTAHFPTDTSYYSAAHFYILDTIKGLSYYF